MYEKSGPRLCIQLGLLSSQEEPHDMMMFHNLITRIDIISDWGGWVHFIGFCLCNFTPCAAI